MWESFSIPLSVGMKAGLFFLRAISFLVSAIFLALKTRALEMFLMVSQNVARAKNKSWIDIPFSVWGANSSKYQSVITKTDYVHFMKLMPLLTFVQSNKKCIKNRTKIISTEKIIGHRSSLVLKL